MADQAGQAKRVRAPSRPYPLVSLKEALRIPQAITDNNAGRPMKRLLLANAVKFSPASSGFRELIAASARYGLTSGNYASDVIELGAVGRAITKPTSASERIDALRTAMKSIPLFNQLLEHFNNAKLPSTDFLANTLERQYGVDPAWTAEAAKVFVETARFVGVVRAVSGSPYVMMDAGPPPLDEEVGEELRSPDVVGESGDGVPAFQSSATQRPPPASPFATIQKRQFFVAHGSDREALSQLQSMLKDLGIPFVTAVDEAHAGRPISQKVADLMKESSGGLFVFSGDEEVTTPEGKIEKRPRMNVVFELGAASLLYGQRIVIFKEKDVVFPSDFRDLGFIEYERGKLAGTSLLLLKELIKLGAVQLLPGGV